MKSMSPLFGRALSGGGLKAVFIALLCGAALIWAAFFTVDAISRGLYKPIPGAMSSATSIYAFQAVLYVLPLLVAALLFVYSSLIASFSDIISGRGFTLSGFLRGGVRFFLPSLGFGVVYLVPFSAISLAAGYFIGDLSGDNVVPAVAGILMGWLFLVVVAPLHTLSAAGRPVKGYLSRNWKALAPVSIVMILFCAALLALLPRWEYGLFLLAGIIFCGYALYMLHILCLASPADSA
ncbi:MAG: hypothetical protein RDV48_20585 [Candidatus Eremiobacteraeota bacterium]|nr:hypothetical protein [Candidatus Eremiobacteraeota bacterium]